MRSILVSSIIIGAACFPASAATRTHKLPPIIAEKEPHQHMDRYGVYAKPAPVAKCDTPVADALKAMAEGTKGISISKALTDAQYSFLKSVVKEHSKTKKELPGDGAFVIASDGEFIVALTQGLDESAMVCAVMKVPAELVAGIVAAGKPPQTDDPKKGDYL